MKKLFYSCLISAIIIFLSAIAHIIAVDCLGVKNISFGDMCAFTVIGFVAPIIRKHFEDGDVW